VQQSEALSLIKANLEVISITEHIKKNVSAAANKNLFSKDINFKVE